MSEPLSKVLGLERINIDLYKSPVFRAEILGRNKALDDLDQRSPDVEYLETMLRLAKTNYENYVCKKLKLNNVELNKIKKNLTFKQLRDVLPFESFLAQEIINKIDVWIVKKGK